MSAIPYLFTKGELSLALDRQLQTARRDVDVIPQDQFLATPVDDIVDHVVDRHRLEPLALHEDRMVRDQEEIQIDVAGWPGRYTIGEGPCPIPGVRVILSVPFSGAPVLWHLRPTTCSSVLPFGKINGRVLEIVVESPLDESLERIKARFDENLASIKRHIEWQRGTIVQFNSGLPQAVRSAIDARRMRLEKHAALGELLNIPLRRDPNAPEIRQIPVQRRIVKPLPPPPAGGYKQEWTIDAQEYENILSILRHEGRTFEATPKTYAVHGEEDLRNILLAHLNGYYKGGATGETFRQSGKTDIRIEAESRVAFVAECKVWKGSQTISESVDQLLSYLSWRDCKTAILVFNKSVGGFSDLLAKTLPQIQRHPRLMRVSDVPCEGEWRVIFRSRDDDARLVYVHVFLFNLFVPGAGKRKSREKL